MKFYQKEIKKTQGSSYLAFVIDEKDSAWIDKGKAGPINLMLLDLFKHAYPLADIRYAIPPFLSNKGAAGEPLLLINVIEWSASGGPQTDALLRVTLSSMIKNKILTIQDANNILEESAKILSIPYVKFLQNENKPIVDDKSVKNNPKEKADHQKNYCGFKQGFLL